MHRHEHAGIYGLPLLTCLARNLIVAAPSAWMSIFLAPIADQVRDIFPFSFSFCKGTCFIFSRDIISLTEQNIAHDGRGPTFLIIGSEFRISIP